MKCTFLQLFIAFLMMSCSQICSGQNTIKIFDTLTYYDGYANVVSEPLPPGVIRHRNDLYARKLSTAELDAVGSTLNMKVTIGALCDNYDRIGKVNLAFVPKGAATYNPESVMRIEIARYITPFMNKNIQPVTVPYAYETDNIGYLFKESSITNVYDIWVELEVFGVPYAANTEVAGCSGRNDVFHGSLEFVTNTAVPSQNNNVLVPICFSKDFNNYNAQATDTLGKTTKTLHFTVPAALTDAALFLITSNHGANAGGEEYNRRNHYVYVDQQLKLTYKPGRTSCEPFRQYNTQGNGIYGSSPKSDAQWQSFSNWCPGDVITTRRIDLGSLTAGEHSMQIMVPDAVFAAGQGNIPLSVYLQGKTSGTLSIHPASNIAGLFTLYPNPAQNSLTIGNSSGLVITGISMVNTLGKTVYQSGTSGTGIKTIDLSHLNAGIYIVHIATASGIMTEKFLICR